MDENIVEKKKLAKLLTLLESPVVSFRKKGMDEVSNLIKVHPTKISKRIGICGPPGIGKSTFIEKLGLTILQQNFSVGVICIDPSSEVNGGSILGDKTRMNELSVHPRAFVRASPSMAQLGGVGAIPLESLLAMEQFGYDYVLIETVGLGQSEIHIRNLCDVLIVLLAANNGDDLQIMKKGIMEHADIIVIHKSDELSDLQKIQVENLYKNPNSSKKYAVYVMSSLEKEPSVHHQKLFSFMNQYWNEIQLNGKLTSLREEQKIQCALQEIYFLTKNLIKDKKIVLEDKQKNCSTLELAIKLGRGLVENLEF